jgi:hypothetical protein
MKRVLIAIGTLLLILLLAGSFFAYRFREAFRAIGRAPTMPDNLRIARVVSGDRLFSRKTFYNESGLGVVTDIQQEENHRLVVAGQHGASFLDEDGSSARSIHFEQCSSDVVIVKVGAGAFLCRGAWSKGAMLIDAEGNALWSYGGGVVGVDDAAAGALGPGDAEEIVVGLNGDGGIRLLDSGGKQIWKQEDGNVWHVEIAPAGEGSGNVILHSNARGQLTLRDASGKVLARHAPEVYLASFSLSAWKDDPHLNKVVAAQEGSVYILTMDGRTLARLPAPGNTGIAEPKGTLVHFIEGDPHYAVLLRHSLWGRSLLYIYDASDQLIYNEVLDHDCAALRALPGQNGAEELLIGCNGFVEKYSLNR